MNQFEKTSEYIRASWIKALKKRDRDPDFVLPYDYVPPCIGHFTDLYYWDTYFTNVGLFCDGLGQLAVQNVEVLKFCLRKFGCVPNCCASGGALFASQPPLLSMMIANAFDYTGDTEFLRDGYDALKEEYAFWMKERIAPNGFNRYGTNMKDETQLVEAANGYARRIGRNISSLSAEEQCEIARNSISEGESGEDHTRRFRGRAYSVNPVDLNCHLYALERNMERFAAVLKNGEENIWKDAAAMRAERLRKYCRDEKTGVFFDYDFGADERTGIYCAANYMPYVVGITSDLNALSSINERLCLPHGVVSCEKLPPNGESYQWGYPNVWAPHNYFAYLANVRAENFETAEKIRAAYLTTVSDTFIREGKFYEKYDGEHGGSAVVSEYGTPEMLGWTAGVYQYFHKKCNTPPKKFEGIL